MRMSADVLTSHKLKFVSSSHPFIGAYGLFKSMPILRICSIWPRSVACHWCRHPHLVNKIADISLDERLSTADFVLEIF